MRTGLILSLAGDVALRWPIRGFLPGLVAFLLAQLAHIDKFAAPLPPASLWILTTYWLVQGCIASALRARRRRAVRNSRSAMRAALWA